MPQLSLSYDRLYHGPLQRGLDTEYRIITGLASMTDAELDRVCRTLSKINLAPFFFGEWRPILAEPSRSSCAIGACCGG